jgi:adenylate cyclase class 2
MQIETEVKIKLPNYKQVEKKIKNLGARPEGREHQVDIYYSLPTGPLFIPPNPNRLRLRLNKKSGKASFDFHISKSDTAAEEREVEVADYKIMKDILRGLKFRVNGIIDKKRIKYKYKKFNITFDLVRGLGNFMEIELMGGKIKDNERKIYELIKALGIKKENISNERYLAMLRRREIIKK